MHHDHLWAFKRPALEKVRIFYKAYDPFEEIISTNAVSADYTQPLKKGAWHTTSSTHEDHGKERQEVMQLRNTLPSGFDQSVRNVCHLTVMRRHPLAPHAGG